MNTSSKPDEYLVLSRGQWDEQASKAHIEVAIGKFYDWYERNLRTGRFKPGSRLSTEAAMVSQSGIATDGPFGETKEIIGGYWIIIARSLREAARVAAENPCLRYGLRFEIRPLDAARGSAYSVSNETPPTAEPSMSKTKKVPASIVWFEIPADDTARAKKFYQALFGWKINPFPGAAIDDYHHIDTGGADASPDGGLMKRMHPKQAITSYILVPSVTSYMAKVKKLGGSVCKPKTAVPGMGYFAICSDTEENTFAIWEMNPKAK